MGYVDEKALQAQSLLGKRVEIPVHYDAWMRGARFGRVTGIGRNGAFMYVTMEHPQIRQRVKVWRMDYDYVRVL